MVGALLKRLGGGQDLFGVAVDPDLRPDAGDPAVRPDQHRHANNAHEGPAVHGFLAPGAVGLEHLVGLVREQGDRELVLLLERILGLDRIGRNPDHFGSGLGKSRPKLRKRDQFPGAAGGVGLRVEVQDEFAALEIGEGDAAAAIARQREWRVPWRPPSGRWPP